MVDLERMKVKQKKTSNLQILINVLIWVFIFALPFLLVNRDTHDFNYARLAHNHAITVIASAFVFYFNYFFLTERYLFKKKTWQFVVLHLLTAIVMGLVVYYLKDFRVETQNMPHSMATRKYLFLFREIFSLAVIGGIAILIKSLSKFFIIDSQRQEEEKRRKEAELINLRQQINPHFFFNTLNNIYALIEISPERAQNTVLELSKLMRYVLYDNENNFVPVNKEIDFIRNYIELMRIRLTNNVDVRTDIQVSPSLDKQVAPMIFISLIENAFKHGVSHSSPSFIHIDIHEVSDHLVGVVRNSYFPKDESDKSGSGIGLENLKKRLSLLYPHKHILRLQEEDNVFTAELVIPFK